MTQSVSADIANADFGPVRLDDRGVLSVTGPDAAAFLHNLVSANIETLADGTGTYASLLTPQGKVLFDFFVVRSGAAYFIDVAADQAAGLAKRLGFYKLRSQVVIGDVSADHRVIAFGESSQPTLPVDAIVFADPRLAGLGLRAILSRDAANAFPPAGEAFEQRRIALGLPAFGADFKSGDVVPHDVNFDDLNAVDFKKGCYVGQEIVSRMKHRGTARRRLVHVRRTDGSSPAMPDPNSDILAGARSIGTMGSSISGRGLAIVRLDWAKDAIDRGVPITSQGIALTVALPAYATFSFPETVVEG